MANDVDVKIKLDSAKAEAQLAKFAAQVNIADERMKQAGLRTQILEQKLEKVANAGQNAGSKLNVFNISLASFIGNITSRLVTAGVSTFISGVQGMIQAGRDFEDGLVSVGKTTGIEGKRLEELGDEIINLSKDIPLASKELLGLATVAGQLGLKSTQDILQFTETMGKLKLATDIAGEEGAQSVAKILTVTGELEQNGTENIDKFGNVITRLGNNFAATEAQILRVANRVAQGTAPFGIVSEDILAIATALKATGSESEASGTAIQKTFRLIGEATQEGGDKLQRFSDAAGLTNEQFVELFKVDPTKLFEQLTSNLGKAGLSGAELNKVLKDLGLSDERLVRSLNPLITQYTTLQRAIADARKESKDKVALDEEAGKAADTLSGDIQRLSSAWEALAKELFDDVGPALRSVVQETTNFINVVTRNRNAVVGALTAIGVAVAVAFLPITATAAAVVASLAAISFALGVFQDSTRNASENTEAYARQVRELDQEYKKLDSNSKAVIDSYSEVVGATGQMATNLVEVNQGLDQTSKNFVELADAAGNSADRISYSATRVALFEQDKTNLLKKFFKEEEQAKLESNFNILKSEKEREDFTAFVASEGRRRQQEAFKATIGLDKATLDAERQRQEELKQLRKAQDQYEDELLNKRLQREAQLQQAQIDADVVEKQAALLAQSDQIMFQDEELGRLTQHLDAITQAEFAAREANLKDELEKQMLMAEARRKGADFEIQQRQRAKQQTEMLERQKTQLQVGLAESAATALVQIAGGNSKVLFAIQKAFAAADIIVKGLQAEALATAQLGIFAPPAVAAIKTNTAIQLATLAATSIGQAASQKFETGGIVGGTSFTGDRVNARVNSGEMILTRQQQTQLFNMANGAGSNSSDKEIVVYTKIQLNEETIAEAVSRQVANGLILGEVQ